MRLYLKQRVFSWRDRFTVYDEQGNDRYYVEGEFFSWGKHLHIYDLQNREVALVRQKLLTFVPRFAVVINDREVAEVCREITFFRPKFRVLGPNWDMEGDFLAHEYQILGSGNPVAAISKQWFTFGDAYEINIAPNQNELAVLATVLALDACISAN